MSISRSFAVAADHVFDGTTRHDKAGVVIDGTHVAKVVPHSELSGVGSVTELPAGVWLAPGFVDLQVNGGGDVLFSDAPTAETILTIAAAHRKFGTTGFLPTLITDRPEKTALAFAAVGEAMRADPAVLGLHLEGPFISPEKPGVHHPAFIRQPTPADLDTLTGPRNGALVVTLAPEQVPAGFIRHLAASGVRVCLGHSMATYAQTHLAISEGLTGFTHLFNAMRPLESREPGPVGAALETPACSYGLIVDAVHVDPAMLRLALRGLGAPMLVTDAMPPVGADDPSYVLYGETITAIDGVVRNAAGSLAGSALDMATAVRNTVQLLRQPLAEAARMASTYPAQFLNVDDRLGYIAEGYQADLVLLDDALQVRGTWIAGQYEAA